MWRTQWNKSEAIKTLYTGRQLAKEFSSHYRIFPNKEGGIDLVMKAVEATTSTYHCEEQTHGEIASAELIALGNSLFSLSFTLYILLILCTATHTTNGRRRIIG